MLRSNRGRLTEPLLNATCATDLKALSQATRNEKLASATNAARQGRGAVSNHRRASAQRGASSLALRVWGIIGRQPGVRPSSVVGESRISVVGGGLGLCAGMPLTGMALSGGDPNAPHPVVHGWSMGRPS